MILDLDLVSSAHLAAAIRRHRQSAARDRLRVPRELLDLEEICRRRVSAGQGGSPVADLCELLDAQAMTPRLVTYADAGRLLSCSLSTVKRLVAAKELTAVYVSGSPRIRVEDIDAYVTSLAEKPRESQEPA